jgi:hypothetical protein
LLAMSSTPSHVPSTKSSGHNRAHLEPSRSNSYNSTRTNLQSPAKEMSLSPCGSRELRAPQSPDQPADLRQRISQDFAVEDQEEQISLLPYEDRRPPSSEDPHDNNHISPPNDGEKVASIVEATISLYIRAVLALVSSMLRDTSF